MPSENSAHNVPCRSQPCVGRFGSTRPSSPGARRTPTDSAWIGARLLDLVSAVSHGVAMNVDEFVETLSRFIGGIAERDPETAAQMRRIEIDLDAEGIVKVTTDVGAGLTSLREGQAPRSEPEPAVHVDVAVAADWLGVDDSRWCHGTVDTDCLLRVLVEESLGESTWSGRLGQRV
jgi:hypothetical protein